MGFAKDHKAKMLAKEAAESAQETGAEEMEETGEFARMLAQLQDHLGELSSIKATDKKAERKRELLPEYMPYIEGVMTADTGTQDQVFMTVLVWAIDCSEFDTAIAMAEYALGHDMAMPERFTRDLPTILAEEIADLVTKGDELNLEQMQTVIDLTDDADMHDQVRAKLFKAAGLVNRHNDKKQQALAMFEDAVRLNDRVGVKPLIKELKKELQPPSQKASKK